MEIQVCQMASVVLIRNQNWVTLTSFIYLAIYYIVQSTDLEGYTTYVESSRLWWS